MLLRALIIVAAVWPAFSLATPPADPVQPQAEVPPVVYRSAFTRYQAMPESEETPDKVWREANETVARIGGHAGYVRDEDPSGKKAGQPAAAPHHQH